jgi:hypothetical protein
MIRRFVGRRGFAGLAFGAAVVAAAVTPQAARAAGDDAEKLIHHGIELRKAHDDEGAARAFQQAYDQVHTPRAAGQLGLAEQALGRWEDAERHVGEALHATGDSWVSKNRATLDEALGTIEAHLGRVEVLGDPEGAEVSINGRSVGKLPLPDAVRVSAGEVDVEMRAPGYVPAQRTLSIVGGQYQRLVLHLAKEAPPEVTATGTKPAGGEASTSPGPGPITPVVTSTPAAEPPSQLRTVLKWSAAGAAGVGLTVGVVATILHANNVSKFDSNPANCADNNGQAVHQQGGSPAPECQGELNAYRDDTTWAIIGFAGAGAFAVTWLVLQLTEGRSHPAAGEQALAGPLCVPSSSGLGLSCAVRF